MPPDILNLTSSAPNASNKIILPRTGSESVDIDCTVNGNGTFEWTLNGRTVQGSTASVMNGDNQVVGQLRISSVTPAHGGVYRCSVSNSVGSDYQELTLTVVGR